MSASKMDRMRWMIALGVAVVILGGGAFWVWRDQAGAGSETTQSASESPAVPTGRLRLLRAGVSEARLLALDDMQRTDDGVEATVVVIGKSSGSLEGGAAVMSQRNRFDCARGRAFDGNMGFFDADGRLVTTRVLYAGRHGRPIATEEAEAAILCRGEKPEAGRIFANFRAAQRELQTPPDNYESVAASRPEDPDVWAWLCSAGARGRWRDTTPGDCEKAVKLNPASAEIRLERGYLNLMTGKRPAAETDFKHIISQEPSNAPALFGQSLVLALRGAKADARTYRVRALDIDPGVADWVELRYGFRVGEEYRTH